MNSRDIEDLIPGPMKQAATKMAAKTAAKAAGNAAKKAAKARPRSGFRIPRRCKCGNALDALFSMVLPYVPAGKLRVEGGVTLNAKERSVTTNAAIEGQSWGNKNSGW